MSDYSPAPGWYPAPHANNEQRYWDGTQWLEPSTTPTLAFAETPMETSPGPETQSPKKSKKGWIIGGSIAAGVIAVGAIGGALGGGTNNDTPVADTKPTTPAVEKTVEPAVKEQPTLVVVPDMTGMAASEAYIAIAAAGLTPPALASLEDPTALVVSTSPAAGTEVEEGSDVTFTLDEKPKLTLGQQNAISKAKSYLSMMGFSRSGLIEQLEFEGYSTDDATFGADNAGADWNAECAEKAQSYIDMMAFSRDGLYDQLAFEGFQQTEIEFGLAAVGY